jgi:hypothetical protein
MLNPFFIQGTNSEQGLVQDLINEQLRMYGIEVYYMPRQYVSKGKVIKEVLYSKFKTAFPIEAYLVNYEGFDSNSITLSKFGIRISDEMSLVISKERFELYISELMKSIPDVPNVLRPNEGDLIYVPLSDSIMEIKYVENRKPFYQLQKNYVYELKCELFEYEDEEISTGILELDDNFADIGYGAVLSLVGLGVTAVATTTIRNGAIQTVNLISGGYRYSSTPAINISSPISGVKATAVGVMTSARKLTSTKSLDKIYIENPGSGYNPSNPPIVSFSGGNGYGASANVGISTLGSIGPITVTYPGQGYYEKPTVTISSPGVGNGVTAIAEAFLNASGGISTIRIINSGYGYTTIPTISISVGATVFTGNYIFGESVVGSVSGAMGIVKDWDADTKKLKVSGMGTDFVVGDLVVGYASSATYRIGGYNTYSLVDAYDNSDVIEEEADDILDFTEVNPFGEV